MTRKYKRDDSGRFAGAGFSLGSKKVKGGKSKRSKTSKGGGMSFALVKPRKRK
jgi:hypothetical protein